MIDPTQIQDALQRVDDQQSFVHELLVGVLDWPIHSGVSSIDEIAYEWTEEELRAEGLHERIVGGRAYQIVLPGNPWGIFVLEFANPDVFETGRGMTGTLRRVLNGLVLKKRGARDAKLAGFSLENLLFICNHRYERFRFAHFKPPTQGDRVAPMSAFGWGPEDLAALRTICEYNLRALEWPEIPPGSEDEWVGLWSSAFDVEKVTRGFYRDYSEAFHSAESAIGSANGVSGDSLRRYTQLLFNRLMFIRFAERKGWLAYPGQVGTHYLAALTSSGGTAGRSIYKSRLEPLFYSGLGGRGRRRSRSYGEVPVVGGGLFEKHPLDDLVQDIPDDVFACDSGPIGLFYRYNFTVEESTPLEVEVAVDPEMLGKVFEELVTGRHGSGSYYTPRSVVAFMCREAVKGYLAARTPVSSDLIDDLIDDQDVSELDPDDRTMLDEALAAVTAVDPACGSGAYLLGLLQVLVSARRDLAATELGSGLYDLKLHTITNSLHGVDIDAFATEIAKLRLWLSLAVEAEDPVVLPNLDFKIETGDALLGPDPQSLSDLFLSDVRNRATGLQEAKAEYICASGSRKTTLRRLIESETEQISIGLSEEVGEGVIDWPVHFAEVFADGGGFDIVVANPPYVRKEEIDKQIKQILRKNFAQAITGRSDLYCSFYARGIQLLRDGGMHVYVCSNAWLDAAYGAPLQDYLMSKAEVLAVYDSAVERQFSTASVNTAVTILQRRSQPSRDRESEFVLLQGAMHDALRDASLRRVRRVTQEQLRSLGTLQGNYVGGKWGGVLLRAPDIYHQIFVDADLGMVLLSDVASIDGYIHDNNTGEGFPRRPVLWSVRDAVAVAVDRGSDGVRQIGVKPSGNSTEFSPILFPRTLGTRHIVPWCSDGVLGKEFYKVLPESDEEAISIAAQLNSTLGIMQREIAGIRGLGGGAVKFAARDVAFIKVVPRLRADGLSDAFKRFASVARPDIEMDLESEDRLALDSVIFDAIGLSADERESVYRETLALVMARSQRAKSVSRA